MHTYRHFTNQRGYKGMGTLLYFHTTEYSHVMRVHLHILFKQCHHHHYHNYQFFTKHKSPYSLLHLITITVSIHYCTCHQHHHHHHHINKPLICLLPHLSLVTTTNLTSTVHFITLPPLQNHISSK